MSSSELGHAWFSPSQSWGLFGCSESTNNNGRILVTFVSLEYGPDTIMNTPSKSWILPDSRYVGLVYAYDLIQNDPSFQRQLDEHMLIRGIKKEKMIEYEKKLHQEISPV